MRRMIMTMMMRRMMTPPGRPYEDAPLDKLTGSGSVPSVRWRGDR
jgi:hypothetical protein